MEESQIYTYKRIWSNWIGFRVIFQPNPTSPGWKCSLQSISW